MVIKLSPESLHEKKILLVTLISSNIAVDHRHCATQRNLLQMRYLKIEDGEELAPVNIKKVKYFIVP